MKRFFYCILVVGFVIITISCQSKNDTFIAQPQADVYFKAGTIIPLSDAKFQVTDERIARGSYLANGILRCFSCHSNFWKSQPGDSLFEARKGEGVSMVRKTDSLRLYSMNITPDTLTGIGGYTDAEVATAIRKGIGKDGRKMMNMPVYDYRTLTNEDLVSVVVYLKTLKPVVKEIPKRKLTKRIEAMLEFDPFLQNTDTLLEAPDMTNPIERGKYLVNLGHCLTCHTSWEGGQPHFLGGGLAIESRAGLVYSTNITSDSTGIGNWTKQDFINVIKTGKSGTLSDAMPWMYFRNMTEDDLGAIYLALKTTPPVKHLVVNGIESTYCEVCNTKHGMGAANKVTQIIPVKEIIRDDISGNYKSVLNAVKVHIEKRGDKFIAAFFGDEAELIPVAENYYSMGKYAPIRFIKEKNKITAMLFHTLDNNYYIKMPESEVGKGVSE